MNKLTVEKLHEMRSTALSQYANEHEWKWVIRSVKVIHPIMALPSNEAYLSPFQNPFTDRDRTLIPTHIFNSTIVYDSTSKDDIVLWCERFGLVVKLID